LEGARDTHLGDSMAVHMVESLTTKSDRAFLRRVDTVDAVKHRTLASTVGADDGAHLMLAHIERNIGQRFHAAKAQTDVLDVENDITYFLLMPPALLVQRFSCPRYARLR